MTVRRASGAVAPAVPPRDAASSAPPSAQPSPASTAPASRGWTPAAQKSAGPAPSGPWPISKQPAAGDWNFQDSVREFQKPDHIPSEVRSKHGGATEAQLRRGVSSSWVQDVAHAGKTERLTVELTQKLIPVPYEEFARRLPADQWGGSNLARSLGGEVQVVARDAQGRPTKQVERMVLAQDDLAPLLGPTGRKLAGTFANDMTKAETITYGKDSARVDWRVYGSDNGSTLADVGSVTFEKRGAGTLVTFHSAHRLGVPGTNLVGADPIALPAALVGLPLQGAFLAHANKYEAVVTGGK